MGSGTRKIPKLATNVLGERRKRNPTVAVVLKPESFRKLVRLAGEDGRYPSALASLLLEIALEAMEAAGSYKALRQKFEPAEVFTKETGKGARADSGKLQRST